MIKRSINILIGVALIIGTGLFVYISKSLSEDELRNSLNLTTPSTALGNVPGNVAPTNAIPVTNTQPTAPAPAPKPTPTPAPKPSGITLAQIAQHNSRSSCWSAINGYVYDLTSWIPNHPGGERNILIICGLDGSSKYNAQHGGESKPARILTGFKIGTLAK